MVNFFQQYLDNKNIYRIFFAKDLEKLNIDTSEAIITTSNIQSNEYRIRKNKNNQHMCRYINNPL
jgi:hypothetical protein